MQQQEQRQNTGYTTPQFEDGGLFKGEIVQVGVTLSPQVHMSVRQDVVVTAFTANNVAFEVLFAGRRKAEARWLLTYLADLRYQGANPEKTRVQVHLVGAWRTTFAPDPSGWETRRRQLVAAVWTVKTPQGLRTFGEHPVV